MFSLRVGVRCDIKVFQVELFWVVIIFRVGGVLWLELLDHFHWIVHGRGYKIIQLIDIGQALLCTRISNTALFSTRGVPVILNAIFFRLYDLTLIHIMSGAVQGAGRLVVVFSSVLFDSSSEGFVAWFGPVLDNLYFWRLTPEWLVFLFGCAMSPRSSFIFLWWFPYALRNWLVRRGTWWLLRSLPQIAAYTTCAVSQK